MIIVVFMSDRANEEQVSDFAAFTDTQIRLAIIFMGIIGFIIGYAVGSLIH